jgi:transcriptional regulator with XRE-family HTH domain
MSGYAPAQPAAAAMLRTLGAVIRAARRARGLSQEAFADRAQFDRTYPSLLERGLRDPKLSTLLRVSAALDCTLLQLLGAASAARRTSPEGAAHRSSPDAPQLAHGSSEEVPPGVQPSAEPTRLRSAAVQRPVAQRPVQPPAGRPRTQLADLNKPTYGTPAQKEGGLT